jgi:hypothetical protein
VGPLFKGSGFLKVPGSQTPAADGRSLSRLRSGLSPERMALELGRWYIAEALVQPGVVEPAEELDDRQLKLGA